MERLLYLMDYKIRWLIIIVIVTNRWYIIIIYNNTSSTSFPFCTIGLNRILYREVEMCFNPKASIISWFCLILSNLATLYLSILLVYLALFWNYVLTWKISTIAINLTSSNSQVQNLNTIATNSTQQMTTSISISSSR